MRVGGHLEKIKKLENIMLKLDEEEDHETIVENCVLGAAHCINASLHKLGKLRIDKDIKHNLLEGYLKCDGKVQSTFPIILGKASGFSVRREKAIEEKSLEISGLMGKIERLRPSHIYDSGRDGNIARIAKESYFKIKKICEVIIGEQV